MNESNSLRSNENILHSGSTKTESSQNEKKDTNASILPAICRAFGPTFLIASVFKLLDDLLIFVSPQILRLLIRFVDSTSDQSPVVANITRYTTIMPVEVDTCPLVEPEPMWHGVLFVIALFAVAALKTMMAKQHNHIILTVALRVRTAIIGVIYGKALVLSNAARKEATVGEIVNLMAVDAHRIEDTTDFIPMIWSVPLQIGLALYFLADLLGASVLAGKCNKSMHRFSMNVDILLCRFRSDAPNHSCECCCVENKEEIAFP